VVDHDVSQGVAHPLLEASPPSFGLAKAASLDRAASRERARKALAEQPVLGRVSLDYGWMGSGALTATEASRAGAQDRRAIQGGDRCALATPSCSGQVVFELLTHRRDRPG
jgi:hypothetical protein